MPPSLGWGVSPWGLCAIPCCRLPCPALQHSSRRSTPWGRQCWSKKQDPAVGRWEGPCAGWGSLQPRCTCGNTGKSGVLAPWDVAQCVQGARGRAVQSCPCTLRPCSCVCPLCLHRCHRGTRSPSSPEQHLWSSDPHHAGMGQPEWDGLGGCTQAW